VYGVEVSPVRRIAVTAAALALAAAAAGCGPAGPRDQGGEKADPVGLLRILPVPRGLEDVAPARLVTPAVAVPAMTGDRRAAVADRVAGAGIGDTGMRTFRTPGGGTMAAVVSVWPTAQIASNFAIQVAQQRLGEPGVRAWTPSSVRGAQGVRETGGRGERVVARAVGPNVIVVRALGDVPDRAVADTARRLVEVQDARD
jgi:hypothetical protein